VEVLLDGGATELVISSRVHKKVGIKNKKNEKYLLPRS